MERENDREIVIPRRYKWMSAEQLEKECEKQMRITGVLRKFRKRKKKNIPSDLVKWKD